MQESETENESVWANTPVANLVRYIPSSKYFARARVGGKLIRKSLETDVFSVAQLRLGDLVKIERRGLESRSSAARGKMTFADAPAIYKERLTANPALKPSAILYRQKRIDALAKIMVDITMVLNIIGA